MPPPLSPLRSNVRSLGSHGGSHSRERPLRRALKRLGKHLAPPLVVEPTDGVVDGAAGGADGNARRLASAGGGLRGEGSATQSQQWSTSTWVPSEAQRDGSKKQAPQQTNHGGPHGVSVSGAIPNPDSV